MDQFCFSSDSLINYELSREDLGSINVTRDRDQYVFGYPCGISSKNCTPYKVNLQRGQYRIEAWGSSGSAAHSKIPGLGGYTSGILNVNEYLEIYLYIGSTTIFNLKIDAPVNGPISGAATDIRLNVSENFEWFDALSLRSRIMVAGGGGGAEWEGSIGGNAGGLEGDAGISGCRFPSYGSINPDIISKGGTQISGGFASKLNRLAGGTFTGYDGAFGMISFSDLRDNGGIGGNGYYSGGSIQYAGAGGGGSSFVSGYSGCIALNSSLDETPSETNSSIHYSGISFMNPSMQKGNTTMPLYYNRRAYGIGNTGSGAVRITILDYQFTCANPRFVFRAEIISPFIFVYIS